MKIIPSGLVFAYEKNAASVQLIVVFKGEIFVFENDGVIDGMCSWGSVEEFEPDARFLMSRLILAISGGECDNLRSALEYV